MAGDGKPHVEQLGAGIHVLENVTMFNIFDRLADALDFDRPEAAGYSKMGAFLASKGYGGGVLPG